MSVDQVVTSFVVMWAVIDPIGTVPVFIAVTRDYDNKVKRRIALQAATIAAGILLFFIIVGEVLLRAMGIPLPAFQMAGGLILFIFAMSMVFGDSTPESESEGVDASEVAVFPLATPSIASPGAMMAVVLLTENGSSSVMDQVLIAVLMLIVVGIVYLLMLGAGGISKVIGSGGASIISRVMGLILASIAATNVLEGLKEYFG